MSTTAVQPQTSLTPILDCLAPMPDPVKPGADAANLIARGIGFLIGVGIGLAGLWILSNWEQMYPGTRPEINLLVIVPTIVLVLLAILVIHESGHLLVGLCVGFRFNSMYISRIQINRPFRISRYRGSGGWFNGGVHLLPNKAANLGPRALIMVFAGPAANLLSAYVLFLLPYSKGFASKSFIFLSAIVGVLNLIPGRGKVTLTDGARILMLLQNRGRGERFLAILKLAGEMAEGITPESLSPDFLAKATAIRDNSPDTVTGYYMAYCAAWWQHKDAEAPELLETCLQYSGYTTPMVREALICDAAVFQARRRKRVDLATQWLVILPDLTILPGLHARVHAGILEAKGDIEGALKKLDEVETSILALPNEMQRKVSLESLKRWRSELLAPEHK